MMSRLIVLLIVAALGFAAEPVGGNWRGTVEAKDIHGTLRESPVTLELSQSGDSVSGAFVSDGVRYAIGHGRVNGDQLTLNATGNSGRRLETVLTISGRTLRGDLKLFQDGGVQQGRIALDRQ